MSNRKIGFLLCCAVLAAGPVHGFDGHQVTEGPLILTIGKIDRVIKTESPVLVPVAISNAGAETLSVTLELKGLLDDCRVLGETRKKVSVEPGHPGATSFQFVMRQGSYSAHYPAHVHAAFTSEGKRLAAHAIQVFETEFPTALLRESMASAALPVNTVPVAGALALAQLPTHRFGWNHFDQPENYLPVGWQGSVAEAGASLGGA